MFQSQNKLSIQDKHVFFFEYLDKIEGNPKSVDRWINQLLLINFIDSGMENSKLTK